METTVSATEARIHFGEMIRRVAEAEEAIVVEKAGTPQLVMLSIGRYQQLIQAQAAQQQSAWERITAVHALIRQRRGDAPLQPSVVDIIHQMREERDEQLLAHLS
jgi:prevent-host-death family protein